MWGFGSAAGMGNETGETQNMPQLNTARLMTIRFLMRDILMEWTTSPAVAEGVEYDGCLNRTCASVAVGGAPFELMRDAPSQQSYSLSASVPSRQALLQQSSTFKLINLLQG
jgi:hypothetical protein